MARPSVLLPLAGPLAGQRLEVHGAEVVIGSGLDCAVRIVAPGIEAQHARIVIDVTGATIYALGGVVGVNDDVVGGAALLRSGDFVWLGEPGGALSLMLQFTLGDAEEAGAVAAPVASVFESPSGELVEEVLSDDLAPQSSGADVPLGSEADPAAFAAATASGFEMMEMAPEQWVEEAQPQMEPADLEPADIAPITELEQFFPASMDERPSEPARSAAVPPAPWHMASATDAPEPAAEYASAWETAASPAAPVETESTVLLQASAEEAPAPPPAAPRRPVTAPTLRIKARTVEQDAALRTPMPPPPPARTTASTPMIVGGLGLLVVLGIVGLLSLRPSPEPVAPAPTPAPEPVVESTPAPVAPTPVTEPTQVPVVEPIPAKPLPTATPTVAPTPRVAATPPPKPTPTPNATPTPAATRPGAVAPAVATPAAPVSQAPRLLEEARAAVAARDYPKAGQLLDQVLRIEPGNAEATARKSEVDARIAILGRKFSAGATTVLGGKSAKGLTGFDLGGGAVVKTDFSAQIRCTITPASVEPGTTYSVRCSIVNIGTKPFRLDSVATNESTDGAKVAGTGVFPRQDLPPQSDTVILQKSGTWTAKSQWSMEIVAKTTKEESFRAVHSWR